MTIDDFLTEIIPIQDKELFQIEQEDPTLAEYHLNQNEIDEFNRLKEEIKKLGIEKTKKVYYQSRNNLPFFESNHRPFLCHIFH